MQLDEPGRSLLKAMISAVMSSALVRPVIAALMGIMCLASTARTPRLMHRYLLATAPGAPRSASSLCWVVRW